MATIRFDASLEITAGRAILRLPKPASKKLPSRGQVAVSGTLNGHRFQTVVEPNGDFGHWISVDKKLQKTAGVDAGDIARVEVEPTKDWPEPRVPADLMEALESAPQSIRELWQAITPMARWEWVRWVNATKNPGTRSKRVEVTLSKLRSGKRRPCCFNLGSCTDPQLSKNGKLIDLAKPAKAKAVELQDALAQTAHLYAIDEKVLAKLLKDPAGFPGLTRSAPSHECALYTSLNYLVTGKAKPGPKDRIFGMLLGSKKVKCEVLQSSEFGANSSEEVRSINGMLHSYDFDFDLRPKVTSVKFSALKKAGVLDADDYRDGDPKYAADLKKAYKKLCEFYREASVSKHAVVMHVGGA